MSELVVYSSKLVYTTKAKCEDLIEVNVILGIDHTQKLVNLLLLTTDRAKLLLAVLLRRWPT